MAAECAEDLAADGVVYAEVRLAGAARQQEPRPGTGGHRGAGRLPAGQRRTRYHRVCAAHRDADRRTLAGDRRDRGPAPGRGRGRVRHQGAEAGSPPTRHLDAFQYVARENFHITIHAGEGFGLPSIWEALQWCGAERLGHGVRIVDDIRITADGTAQGLGGLASMCGTADAVVERADRRGPVHRGPPDRAAAPAVLPGHRQHRQPADERGEPGGFAARRWGAAGPTSNGSRSTR